MKYAIKIHKISTVDDLENAWSLQDYNTLLDRFELPNTESTDLKELRELLFMAIADKDPSEAARIVLDYKLSDEMNEHQIDSVSYEMLVDKISEEYPRIGLHKTLFVINQLLYKAFNGKFPNTNATIIDFEITPKQNAETNITKEIVLKCFAQNLDKHNVIKRLFHKQLDGKEPFNEANNIIWELQKKDTDYQLITSDYFMSRTDFIHKEFESKILLFDEE